jgi:drug/metabolite transporter (DMT)-like permease
VFIHATSALLASVYLGVVSTAIAFLMYYHLIREWGVVRASSVTYIAPIIALFWDFVFFRNEPGLFEGIGITAILCGVVLIQLTKKT